MRSPRNHDRSYPASDRKIGSRRRWGGATAVSVTGSSQDAVEPAEGEHTAEPEEDPEQERTVVRHEPGLAHVEHASRPRTEHGEEHDGHDEVGGTPSSSRMHPAMAAGVRTSPM